VWVNGRFRVRVGDEGRSGKERWLELESVGIWDGGGIGLGVVIGVVTGVALGVGVTCPSEVSDSNKE
jgi:hypothetical protein